MFNARPQFLAVSAALLGLLIGGCGSNDAPAPEASQPAAKEAKMTLQLSSSAFQNNAQVPKIHTEDGDDTSPPLRAAATSTGGRCQSPSGTWRIDSDAKSGVILRPEFPG